MSVTIIRPELSDEEREKRMQAVDAAVCRVFTAMQAAEAARQAQKKSAPRPERQYTRICAYCGEEFISKACNTKYCPGCKDKAYYERSSAHSKEKYNATRRAERQKKYIEGVIYVCDCCGKRIKVHERTQRKTCNACMERKGGIYLDRLLLRKDIEEEVLD